MKVAEEKDGGRKKMANSKVAVKRKRKKNSNNKVLTEEAKKWNECRGRERDRDLIIFGRLQERLYL